MEFGVVSMSTDALKRRWHELNAELSEADVQLLAVSKYAPDAALQIVMDAGQLCFGESRAQQLRDRAEAWPACDWHMIGPVQKNKAKYIGRHASMWHSCDDLQTAQAVARHVHGRKLPVLIQVNIDHVPNQRGIDAVELPAFAAELVKMDGLRLAGLMCMAGKDGDAGQAFRDLRGLRDELRHEWSRNNANRVEAGSLELCMGMSSDYRQAVAEGSSMVRLGSALFGDWDVRRPPAV